MHNFSIFCLTHILAVTLHRFIHVRTLLTLTHLNAHYAIICLSQLCVELLKQTHLVLRVSSTTTTARLATLVTNAGLINHKVVARGRGGRLCTAII